jgi:hypothetical protein
MNKRVRPGHENGLIEAGTIYNEPCLLIMGCGGRLWIVKERISKERVFQITVVGIFINLVV